MTLRQPIDPELAALATLMPYIDLDDPVQARKMDRTIVGELRKSARADDYERLGLARPDGSEFSIAVHRPVPPRAGEILPVLVFLHGGSFITGGLYSELERCAFYAESARCAVLSVDYRLAPEHPFPAALEDCLRVVEWLGTEGDEHGLDRERVAIGGLSAGGALAAATALCLRDTRVGAATAGPGVPAPGLGAMSVRLVLQMLLFPVLDASVSTPSARQFTDTPVLQAHQLPTLWRAYLGDSGEPGTSWASPALAAGFADCPPAYIAVAQLDPLRDEALRFAERMIAADIPVDLRMYARAYHSFDTFHTTRIGRIARHHQAESLAAALR